MPDFRLPDLGEGLTEAEIVSWRVAPGDQVNVDQTVVEMETAKAVVDVPIPFAGTVAMLHGRVGDLIAVGAPLISIAAGSDSPEGGSPKGGSVDGGDVESGKGQSGNLQSGNVLIGYGTAPEAARRRRPLRGSRRALPPAATPADAATEVGATTAGAPAAIGVISPLVRRLARESGVDLDAVTGTGAEGIVLRRDVDAAITARAGHRPDAADQQGSVPDPVEQRIPLRGLRKVVADKLSRSRREIPEATVWVDVDATELLAVRRELNARRPDQPVSVLGLVARFAVLGLRRYPELNGRVEQDEIVLTSQVNLGFAAQTERGLVVPVIKGAERLSTRELSAALSRHTAAGRAGTLTSPDLTGGSFTVNNYGVFGVDGSAAIINHPEVAILGLGRIIDRPWVVDGSLAVRKLTQLTLTFDHRVCDGGTAGGFLRLVADCVESPVRALGDL